MSNLAQLSGTTPCSYDHRIIQMPACFSFCGKLVAWVNRAAESSGRGEAKKLFLLLQGMASHMHAAVESGE